MDIIKNIFQCKTVNLEKLTAYGFSKKADIYSYSTTLPDSNFKMTVNVTKQGEVTASVIDPALNEPYTLHLVDAAVGSFVGNVKTEYEQLLTKIANQCFEPDVFQSQQAKAVIDYIRDTYCGELEYLWQKFPNNAVVRRTDNQKWYALLLTVSCQKIGFKSDEIIEILDLRMTPENIEKSVDGIKFLPGYHMNKKHWITICLNGTVSLEEIYPLIDDSYNLAVK